MALQIIEARRDMGQPHLAVGMLGVGGHKGGQGGAGMFDFEAWKRRVDKIDDSWRQ